MTLPAAAPHDAAMASAYMAGQAEAWERTAEDEHRRGASAKRTGFTRRIAAIYRDAAARFRPGAADVATTTAGAIVVSEPAPTLDALEDMLS